MGHAQSAEVGLTSAQRAALESVREVAAFLRPGAKERLAAAFGAEGLDDSVLGEFASTIRRGARVVIHFHPDRRTRDGRRTIDGLLEHGVYRSQFETGTSSGSRSARPGGERDLWERRLFGGAYQDSGAGLDERPKYGALELVRHPDGPWPRFGSCYLVLRPEISHRASFSFSGSEQAWALDSLGTLEILEPVLAPLFEEIAAGEGTRVEWPPFRAPSLGVVSATVPGFVERVRSDLARERASVISGPLGRVLDSGIEAQVHGAIELARDVELIVADPSFVGTAIGRDLEALGSRFGFHLGWHPGYELLASEVPDDFRGPNMRPLAEQICGGGPLNAQVLGEAEASLARDPQGWEALKKLWHVLVHFGRPAGGRWDN